MIGPQETYLHSLKVSGEEEGRRRRGASPQKVRGGSERTKRTKQNLESTAKEIKAGGQIDRQGETETKHKRDVSKIK